MNRWKKLALSGTGSTVLLASLVGYFEPSPTPGVPYQDVTGKWTNCLGNTHEVDPRLFYTSEQCKVIDGENELTDLQALATYVKVPLTNGQRAAFADFIHNVGSANFHHSTMLQYLNRKQYTFACDQLLRWVYAKGRKLNGLVIRRNAEYQMCIAEE